MRSDKSKITDAINAIQAIRPSYMSRYLTRFSKDELCLSLKDFVTREKAQMRLFRFEVLKERGTVKLDSLLHIRYIQKCGSWLSGRVVVTLVSPQKELRSELDFGTDTWVESSEYRKYKAFCFGPKRYCKVGTAWNIEKHNGYVICP